jgi:signal transduction histidine kinase/CheY-like chemotaxis protein
MAASRSPGPHSPEPIDTGPAAGAAAEPAPAEQRDAASLARDLAEAVEQQAATSDVLATMGRAAFELEPVFETVVRHAVRLCDADAGLIYRRDGDVYRLATALGGSEEYQRYLREHPAGRGPGTLVGLVGLERRTVQITDARSDPRYQWQQARELGGFRTMLGVPMLADDRVVGVIVLWRSTVEPFRERTIRLVTTFAAQGAIAIQNVELFQALQQRSAELARSVDELRALGEVSQAVSASLAIDEDVLATIVARAAELSGADGGSIFELDRDDQAFVLRTCAGTSEELMTDLRGLRIRVGETFIGRAATENRAVQATDLAAEPPDPHLDALLRDGWRSLLAVPLRREHEIVGMLVARRRTPGEFGPETVELLETLASQSAVAIHNARVFRELEEKTRELEIAGRHKSEFLASMSHELRTPLNAVIGFSDVLLERMFGELNERQEEYVLDIRNSGRHLLELINEILDLSKIEAGRMELELGAVSLPALLDHGVAMVRERAVQHGIALELDVAPEVGTVRADEVKLKQVVVNLITNAVKFTPDGGSVSVRAEARGAEAIVSVRDTGIGIPEEERERIFEAFQRGGRGARSSAEGTGLGLTLSRRILDLHRGRLWMESTVGVGSTFSFAVPRMAGEAPADVELVAPAVPVAEAEASGCILVVEDDRRSADLLRVYLEDAGYGVAIARDGMEGLELARSLAPTAVVLDVLLPRLNGWDVLARLKRDPTTAGIPVVVVSMLDERGAGFALGAAEYLVKPVEHDELLRAVTRCVAPPGNGRTVVVIDDDAVDLDLVEAALVPQGWSVVRAQGGEEGVEAVRRERPSVVLLDLLMPGIDGFEVVERLRGDPLVADVPIVVLTSKDMTAADHERLSGRISLLAQKGTFRQDQLADVVRRLSGSGSARQGGSP